MAEKSPKAQSQLLKAKTNVNPQYFLAKNLQINIIRNSFDTLGVLKKMEMVLRNEVTQKTTEF